MSDSNLLGIEKTCPICHSKFRYCQSCWRGHKYCSLTCRQEARKRKRRIAEKKYSAILKGKINRALRQQRFRERTKLSKKVTDRSLKEAKTLLQPLKLIKFTEKSRCQCCKKRIAQMIHRPTQPETSSLHQKFFSFTRV